LNRRLPVLFFSASPPLPPALFGAGISSSLRFVLSPDACQGQPERLEGVSSWNERETSEKPAKIISICFC